MSRFSAVMNVLAKNDQRIKISSPKQRELLNSSKKTEQNTKDIQCKLGGHMH